MTDTKTPPTKHEVLSYQLTNMTFVQRAATQAALQEHADLVERCRFLQEENARLIEDLARHVRRKVEQQQPLEGTVDLLNQPRSSRTPKQRPRLSVKAR